MKKKILLIIFSFLLISTVTSQTIYISSQKNQGVLMIGVEIFDPKTQTSLKPSGYIYEWTFPDISLNPQKTMSNLVFILPTRLDKFLFLDLNVSKPFSKENYFFKNQKVFLPEPKIKIVRKTSDGALLPFSGKLLENESLTVITKNFGSKKLTYVWELNGVFVSNEKEISAVKFPEKKGTLKLKIFGEELREKVEEVQSIQIQ
jgi:hypothetical protein